MAVRGVQGGLQARACLLEAAALLLLCSGAAVAESTVHTVFTTECSKYFSWQTMGGCRGGLSTSLDCRATAQAGELAACRERLPARSAAAAGALRPLNLGPPARGAQA